MCVAPSSIAISKSLLMPIDRDSTACDPFICVRRRSRNSRSRANVGRHASGSCKAAIVIRPRTCTCSHARQASSGPKPSRSSGSKPCLLASPLTLTSSNTGKKAISLCRYSISIAFCNRRTLHRRHGSYGRRAAMRGRPCLRLQMADEMPARQQGTWSPYSPKLLGPTPRRGRRSPIPRVRLRLQPPRFSSPQPASPPNACRSRHAHAAAMRASTAARLARSFSTSIIILTNYRCRGHTTMTYRFLVPTLPGREFIQKPCFPLSEEEFV